MGFTQHPGKITLHAVILKGNNIPKIWTATQTNWTEVMERMVSLVKSLTDTGFDWNDKASCGKDKPQSKDVTAGWGLTHTMLGPDNKVIKWLWTGNETLISSLWKGQLIRKCSAPQTLWLDLQVYEDLKNTTRKTQGRRRRFKCSEDSW